MKLIFKDNNIRSQFNNNENDMTLHILKVYF